MHGSTREGSWLLSAALTLTGVVGLIASVYISGRVGWSLADNPADSIVTAGILGLADFASAMLIIAGSRMRVWGWYGRSYAALAIAVLGIGMGFLSAYGFFSTRIAVHEAQKTAAAIDKDYMKWVQGQTVNMELPKSQRFAMMAEAKASRDTLKSTASVVSDRYAAAIGGWLGWSLEATQRRLTAATAAIAYGVKFAGLWFGVMLWPRRRNESERSLSSSPKGGAEGGGGGVKSTEDSKNKQPANDAANVVPIRAEQAQLQPAPKVSSGPPRVPAPAPRPPLPLTLQSTYATVEDFLARHPSVTSQKVIADAMGVSQAKVSRDIKRLKGRGKVKAERKWRSNQLTFTPRLPGPPGQQRETPRRNGGLHAVI